MKITTLTSPFLLRKYLIEDETLQGLVGQKMYPINAPDTTTGDFLTFTRTGYEDMDVKIGKYNETTTVEVELCSQDYDTAVLLMLDALRQVVEKMRNDGLDVNITDCEEYKYAHVEGGETWNAERVVITLRNIFTEVDLD